MRCSKRSSRARCPPAGLFAAKPSAFAGPVTRGVAEPYDLVSPDKIVRGRMPSLDQINERWTGEFQRALSALIRQPIETSMQEVKIGPYAEWLTSVPSLASFNLLNVKPWQRNALVTIDGALLYVLVDAFYGGEAKSPKNIERNKLSPTEKRLNTLIVNSLVDKFRAAFNAIARIEFELQKTETDPQYTQIATSSETVVITELKVELKETEGTMSLVLPLSSLESVRDKLGSGLQEVSAENKQRWREAMRKQLQRTELELASVFLQTEITMRELLELKPGDILPIEMPKTATVYSGDKPLFNGKFGLSRGYNAISIVGPAPDPWGPKDDGSKT